MAKKRLVIINNSDGSEIHVKFKNGSEFVKLEDPIKKTIEFDCYELNEIGSEGIIDEIRLTEENQGPGAGRSVWGDEYSLDPGSGDLIFHKMWIYSAKSKPDNPDVKFQAIEMSDNSKGG